MDFLNEPDPKKALKQFNKELFGGKLRWLFSFFALLTSWFLAYLIIFKQEPEIYFPIILKGIPTWVALWLVLIIWGILTIISWINWKKNKMQENSKITKGKMEDK
jgi:hypothetical protein